MEESESTRAVAAGLTGFRKIGVIIKDSKIRECVWAIGLKDFEIVQIKRLASTDLESLCIKVEGLFAIQMFTKYVAFWFCRVDTSSGLRVWFDCMECQLELFGSFFFNRGEELF